MQAMEISSYAKVGAVVHDERDVCSQTRPEFTGLFEHLSAAAGLVAVLEQRAAGSREFLGSGKHFGSVGETRYVENRVEPRKKHCTSVVHAFTAVRNIGYRHEITNKIVKRWGVHKQ